MALSWITASYSTALVVFLTALEIYIALMVFTRIAGLRSFSKMSSFDFAVTIAIGTLAASTIVSPQVSFLRGISAIASLYLLQIIVNFLRSRSALLSRFIDNRPLLLMKSSQILDHNLKKARVSRKELRYKLRAANVTQLSEVKAVVMETTGDVTVLKHSDANHKLDKELLEDVRL